jgi:hypothetical protein
MCKLSTYLVVNYLPTYLPTLRDQLFSELITKVKLDINSGQVHPQLSHNSLGGNNISLLKWLVGPPIVRRNIISLYTTGGLAPCSLQRLTPCSQGFTLHIIRYPMDGVLMGAGSL